MKKISKELADYAPELAAKPCFLVLNKIDLLLPEEQEAHCKKIVKELAWPGEVFMISV